MGKKLYRLTLEPVVAQAGERAHLVDALAPVQADGAVLIALVHVPAAVLPLEAGPGAVAGGLDHHNGAVVVVRQHHLGAGAPVQAGVRRAGVQFLFAVRTYRVFKLKCST